MCLTHDDVVEFCARTDQPASGEMIMPNGKRLSDCTFDELADVADALNKLGTMENVSE